MNSTAKLPKTKVKNITSLATNGLAYDWMTNNLYFIDLVEQNIKVIGLNHYNPGIIINAVENSSIDTIAIHPQQK